MALTIFQTICEELGLGNLLSPPAELTGGFLHRMYSLFTEKGRYAVKLLNPEIMEREDALGNYSGAEELEVLLEREGLPILPALSFHGKKLQKLKDQYFYLFPWFEGSALGAGEIRAFHCGEIGKALARIHGIFRKAQPAPREPGAVDWDSYLTRLERENRELFLEAKPYRALLYRLQEQGNAALPLLPRETAVCHNDLDPKNVLWSGEAYRVIDLECLSYDSPYLELYETALNWAGCDFLQIQPELLTAFVASYGANGGILPEDWAVLHDCNTVRLDWLSYNLERALGMRGPGEQKLGIDLAKNTLLRIAYYDKLRDQTGKLLTELCKKERQR